MIAKQYKKRYRACVAFLVILLFFAALLGYDLIAEYVVDLSVRTVPSYAKEDITPVLSKTEWTEEDYAYLYRQTGLGKSALDSLRGSTDSILQFQEALYYEGEPEHMQVAITTKRDKMYYKKKGMGAPIVPLEAGDVLISSVCHSFGWRNGHAALVLDEYGTVAESVALGVPSQVTGGGAFWFQTSANFMVLRLKNVPKEERAQIAAAVRENMLGIPYSITVGIFSAKDQGKRPNETHCAHLVWQAFKNFGYDVDYNGGPLVIPQDIARSDLFEVVQVYGFDVDKLW